MARVLVVDDEASMRATLETLLSRDGHEVVVASDGYLALQLLTAEEFDVVVTDAVMPKLSGDDLITTLRARDVDVEVILMATEPDVASTINALHAGAFDYLKKPVQGNQVCQSVASALKRRSLQQENRQRLEDSKRYTHELEAILSEKSRRLKESEERLAVLSHDSSTSQAAREAAVTSTRPIGDPAKERRELEAQLSQAQRFETLGRLACGVAHDLNNLLTVIFASCSLAREALADDRSIQPDLNNIDAAAERAAALTRQLLAFSRRRALQPKVQDLNGLVTGTSKMLERLLGEDIRLETSLTENLGPVFVDAGQIEQVIANLAVLLRGAMPCGGGLLLGTSEIAAGDAANITGPFASAPHAKLSLRATGENLNHEFLQKVTADVLSPTAEDPGFGLATVRGIITQNAGSFSLLSTSASSVDVCVWLPIADRVAPPKVTNGEVARSPRGNETILLVEANDQVRALSTRILKEHGYFVLEASSVSEALAVDRRTNTIALLLLSDAALPGSGGRVLAETLLRENPRLRILLTSGCNPAAFVADDALPKGAALLPKPFGAMALASRVRDVLDGKDEPLTAAGDQP